MTSSLRRKRRTTARPTTPVRMATSLACLLAAGTVFAQPPVMPAPVSTLSGTAPAPDLLPPPPPPPPKQKSDAAPVGPVAPLVGPSRTLFFQKEVAPPTKFASFRQTGGTDPIAAPPANPDTGE